MSTRPAIEASEEQLSAVTFNADGLVPVITQDGTRVPCQAYSSQPSWYRTAGPSAWCGRTAPLSCQTRSTWINAA